MRRPKVVENIWVLEVSAANMFQRELPFCV